MRLFVKASALTFALILGVFLCSAAWEFTNDPYSRFVRSFNDFTDAQNRGVFDLRKLHKARAAWRELEKGWPEYEKR